MLSFKRANKDEFKYCLDIRLNVFVGEQGFTVEEEIDEFDEKSIHYLVIKNNKYIGTLRVYINNDDGHIGRVAILKEYRHQGIGSKLIKFVEQDLKEIKTLSLGAQIQAQGFYEKLGFLPFGEHYIEGNIDHVNMKKRVRK